MGGEISEEEKIMCYHLCHVEGLSLMEISRRTGISRSTVRSYANGIPLMKKSEVERKREKLRRKGKTIGENIRDNLEKNGFTNTSYREELLERKGTDINEYRDMLARKKGYNSEYERKKIEAERKSGVKLRDLERTREDARKKRKESKELVKIIREFSEKKELSISEISKRMRISKDRMYTYSRGVSFPNCELLNRLYDILDIESNPILDRFLEEEHQSYVTKKRYGVI